MHDQKVTEAVILAGGFGTRLQSVVQDLPKPMAPIGEIPFLTYLLEQCILNEITTVVLAVGYKHPSIIDYYGNNYKTLQIIYSIEDSPLGTGGAIKKALVLCKTPHVLILNGDSICEFNARDLGTSHQTSAAVATLVIKPMTDFERYGSVLIDNQLNVEAFKEKTFCESGFINTGIYVVERSSYNAMTPDGAFSLEQSFLEKFAGSGRLKAHISEGFFIDIGIPEDYALAQELLPIHFRL